MKRDMELVRRILISLADSEYPLDGKLFVDDATSFEKVAYHFEIMQEAGLVKANVQREWGKTAVHAVVGPMTWEGNDFLDAVRNEKVWKRVMTKVAQISGSATFEIVKKLASESLSQMLLG